MAFQAKRKFKRSVQREGIRVTSPAGIEYATYEDISAGGVRLIMDYEKAPHAALEMEFTLRGENGESLGNIRTFGRVVRSIKLQNGYEVGVAFTNLDDRIRSMIERLIDAEEGPF
jgi:c-di-GMP-binding flagellar brake protein YcgR